MPLQNPWMANAPKMNIPGMLDPEVTNPYDASVTASMNQAGNDYSSALLAAQTSQQTQAGLQGQITATQNLDTKASYPSFPNSMGLGTQAAYGAPTTNPSSVNPWSLSGPALTR